MLSWRSRPGNDTRAPFLLAVAPPWSHLGHNLCQLFLLKTDSNNGHHLDPQKPAHKHLFLVIVLS